MTKRTVTIVDVQAYRPGSVTGAGRFGWGRRPWGAPRPPAGVLEDSTTVRASDTGYLTEEVDGDVAAYPALVLEAGDIDRHLELDPTKTVSSVTFGRIKLSNAGGVFNRLATDYTSDSRAVTVRTGFRTYDPERNYLVDPPTSELTTIFSGLAESWLLSEPDLTIPLRDWTYWLERRYLQDIYTGAGGVSGSAAMAGQTIPRTRGGTLANPVMGVQPTLFDPDANIWQWNDGPGELVALYEDKSPEIPFEADTGDLYSGTTTPGRYRTDKSRGQFQLGSPARGVITADVTGEFPVAGAVSRAANLARYIMTEDLALPAGMVDTAAFTALADAMPATSGWFWPSGDPASGADAVSVMLRGLGAKLLPRRDGRLVPVLVRSIPDGAVPVMTLTTAHIDRLVPSPLSAPLDPPAYRWRVGYRRNHAPQSSGVNPSLTEDQRRAAAQEWQAAVWVGLAILGAYARPSDPEVLSTALLLQADAQAAADALGAQWGARPRLYDMDVPKEIAMGLDVGDVVRVEYPFADLLAGRPGQIVGEQRRVGQPQVTFQVLI